MYNGLAVCAISGSQVHRLMAHPVVSFRCDSDHAAFSRSTEVSVGQAYSMSAGCVSGQIMMP